MQNSPAKNQCVCVCMHATLQWLYASAMQANAMQALRTPGVPGQKGVWVKQDECALTHSQTFLSVQQQRQQQ
jgi:hypothetical protein